MLKRFLSIVVGLVAGVAFLSISARAQQAATPQEVTRWLANQQGDLRDLEQRPRVKKPEADQVVIALRERGFPVEYLVVPDESVNDCRR